MKRLIIFFAVISVTGACLAQVTEVKSGVIQMNITRKGADTKKAADEQRALADNTPPMITILSPNLIADPHPKSTSKTLAVRGKVEDAGGIFEVMVNGVEAKVSSDGVFLAEIPQAFGRNNIRIVATDISQNSKTFEFMAERLTDEIASQMNIPVERPAEVYSIDIYEYNDQPMVLASDRFDIKGCIKSSAKIKQIMIYRNESFVNGYPASQIISSGDCDFLINETVPLVMGRNDIDVVFYAGSDTVRKSLLVEYSLHAARNFALIIANESYDDPAISDLGQPVKDATELYNILTNLYNFDTKNVVFLKDPSKSEIIGTLHSFRTLIGPNDNLLIFYAGHGIYDVDMGVGYWLPKDASRSNPVNWLPNTDLTNYLGAIKTKHTLLIADACFSGGIFKTRSAFSNTFAVEKLYQLNSRKAITSGTLKEEVPDKSAFFQYLIKSLKENSSEYLPAEQVFSQMRIAVINNSDNVPQFGTIQNVGDEGGDFIFVRKKQY